MDFLIISLFVIVVAAVVIKRKKPELWEKIRSKMPLWEVKVETICLKDKQRNNRSMILNSVKNN